MRTASDGGLAHAGGFGGDSGLGGDGGARVPVLVITPPVIDLGVIEVGTVSPQRAVWVENVGDAAASVTVKVDGTGLGVDSNCTMLAPGAACEARLHFSASAAGTTGGLIRASASGAAPAEVHVAVAAGYRVTVARHGGGTVSSTPAGIDCGNRCADLFVGPTVELQASWTSVEDFTGWGGGECSGSGPCTLALDGPKTVDASFDTLQGLTVDVVGTSVGKVVVDGGPCTSGTCHYDFDASVTEVYAVANGHDAPDSAFAGWSGGCLGTASSCVVPISGAQVSPPPFRPLLVSTGFVAGNDGAPFLASYSLDGTERWRVAVPAHDVGGVAVRGNRAAVVGTANGVPDERLGWVGTYDLTGILQWGRPWDCPPIPANRRDLSLFDVEIDSDDDLIVAGTQERDWTRMPVGAVSADGLTDQWHALLPEPGCWGGVTVRPDDSVAIAGHNGGEMTQFPQYTVLDESGTVVASKTIMVEEGGSFGIACDASGNTYLAVSAGGGGGPFLERRPP